MPTLTVGDVKQATLYNVGLREIYTSTVNVENGGSSQI
jgi:hypothetical protein